MKSPLQIMERAFLFETIVKDKRVILFSFHCNRKRRALNPLNEIRNHSV